MAIYLVTLICLLNHTGFGGSRVVMSLHALSLGADPFAVGVLMALYALLPVLLAVYAGRLADRAGPLVPMLGGTLGVLVGLLLPAFFPGLATLYLAALVLGTSSQFFFVAVQGSAGAIGAPQERVRNYALLSIGFSLAIFFGPLIAGFSIDYLGGHRAAYLALAASLVPSAVLLWVKREMLPKAARAGAGAESGASAFDLLRIPQLRNTIIASGLLSAAWDLYQFYFPIYGHAAGLSASAIGMVMAMFAAAVFAVRTVISRLAAAWGEFEVLVYAIVLAGFSFLLFPLFTHALPLAAASFLLGLGVGCGQPVSGALIYHLAPHGRAAEGAGLRVMFNNGTHVTVPLLFGGLGAALGFAPVFISCSALLLAGGYYSFRSNARHRMV
ncbi:MAG TPA: MFS transporter [Burkholderiales bacterium]|nr:MFS transporter [Burkholderiales bacterium]